jgi:heptosyltransferase-2
MGDDNHGKPVRMTSIVLNTACRHFHGSRPCTFNKLDGSECATCRHTSEYRDRILFVKLDAIGDVLRTTSVLPAIIARYDSPYIAWVTRRESVDLVAMLDLVDEVIEVSEIGLARVSTGGWDQVFSLSNDVPSAAIATMGAGGRPIIGYGLARGVLEPSNPAARAWLEMAAFDRLKRANTRSYLSIMLEIIS